METSLPLKSMTANLEDVDIREKSRARDGQEQVLDRRLFMQLLAFGDCRDTAVLIKALEQANIPGALYADINDPFGVALVTVSESPDFFVTEMRAFLGKRPFADLSPKPEFTMLGRTYAIGYEPDLEEAVINRPRRRIFDPSLKWGIWYPLRRAGSFEQLSVQEQRVILAEHGGIGRAFGRVGLGTDIRLACHGLDKNDNDFVIGILGPELYPLSTIIQRMRKTKQTSQYLAHLGPFFTGKVIWQNRNKD